MKKISVKLIAVFTGVIASLFCGAIVSAETDVTLEGVWTGESICTVKNSPCHNEHVIYTISEKSEPQTFSVKMEKVVGGGPDWMATLDCGFEPRKNVLTCQMNNGRWEFTLTGDKLSGTLKLGDGTLYRRIAVKKQA